MDLTWYEQHYPFGEVIEEEVACDTGCVLDNLTPMVYGGGTWETSWKPNFRFPGQYEDVDSYPFVQNHYRDYIPGFGRYNRVDPYDEQVLLDLNTTQSFIAYNLIFSDINYFNHFKYANNDPLSYTDKFGLVTYTCNMGYCNAACNLIYSICRRACTSSLMLLCNWGCYTDKQCCYRNCVGCNQCASKTECCVAPSRGC